MSDAGSDGTGSAIQGCYQGDSSQVGGGDDARLRGGIGLALLIARVLEGLMFGITPTDRGTFALAPDQA